MTRWLVIAGASALAFVAALILWFPLSAALALTGARDQGLDWSRAAGTIWNGSIQDAELQRRRLGDIEVSLRFWPLLTGRVSLDAGLAAPGLFGSGVITLGPGDRLAVTGASLRADLARAEGIDPRLRGRPGSFTLDLDRVVFNEAGCVEAAGQAWTDALTHGDPRADWRGPPLTGPAACEGEDLVVRLDGDDGEGEYRVLARMGADRALTVTARVRSQERSLRAFLPLLGFQRDEDVYVYAWPREGA